MSEEAIVRRQNRAVDLAISMLRKSSGSGRAIRITDPDCPFHIQFCRKKEYRIIRIILDKITEQDKRLCQEWEFNESVFTKEMWLKKHNECGFDQIIEI